MARVQEVVADASVACKWFLPEKGTSAALLLRDDHIEGRVRILAPQLLCYEVADALRYYPALSPEGIEESIRYLYDLQLSLVHPTHRDLSSAAAFSPPEGLRLRCVLRHARGETFVPADHRRHPTVEIVAARCPPLRVDRPSMKSRGAPRGTTLGDGLKCE